MSNFANNEASYINLRNLLLINYYVAKNVYFHQIIGENEEFINGSSPYDTSIERLSRCLELFGSFADDAFRVGDHKT